MSLQEKVLQQLLAILKGLPFLVRLIYYIVRYGSWFYVGSLEIYDYSGGLANLDIYQLKTNDKVSILVYSPTHSCIIAFGTCFYLVFPSSSLTPTRTNP